jgi:hypothetical protein
MQCVQAGPGSGGCTALALALASANGEARASSPAQGEQLLQHLVEAQAQEAALRSVLEEVRQEQLATCRAVSNELRRVHALEK